jgi:hypothetical protein
MKIIKNLTVTVTYTVELEDILISDSIAEELSNPDNFVGKQGSKNELREWLIEICKEEDAFNWEFEIDNVEFNND